MKKKSIILVLLIFCFCLTVGLAACSGSNPNLKGLDAVSITNKQELSAEWTEGGADRKVNIALAPEQYTTYNTNVVVESDNTNVIIADGNTLKAVGGGVAKITAYYGNVSDSVTVIVTPKLKKIEISNKAELASAWVSGDDDRAVNVTFNPDYFNTANPNVEITSSATGVVSVDGKNIRAVSVGEAVITATAGDFTDSVKVVVRPALSDFAITDLAALSAEWDLGTANRNVNIDFGGSEYWTTDNTDVAVISSNKDVIKTEGNILSAVGVGTARINVQVRDITKMFTVKVVLGAPVFEVEGETEIAVMDGEKIALPTVSAFTSDNSSRIDDSKINVTLSDAENMTVTNDNTLEVASYGEYTLTYSAIDPRVANKVGSVTINVIVARNIFSGDKGSYLVSKERVPAAEQVVENSNSGYSGARFNITPGKFYYAEALFVGDRFYTPGNWMGVGMGHFAADAENRVLTSFVMNGNNDHKVKDLDTTSASWDFSEGDAANRVYYSWRLGEYRGLDTGTIGQSDRIKYAVARIGDDFFAFVNDQYVCCVSPEYYRNIDTIPGLFGADMRELKITEIDFVSGEVAKTKVNELLKGGSGVASAYVPNEYYLGSKAEGNFTVNVATDERGANFDVNGDNDNKKDYNSSCVSPYVYFDGDFALEWEYKPTWTSHEFGTGNTGSIFELRSINYWSELNKFGVRFLWDGSTPVVQFIAHRPQEEQFGWTNESAKYAQSSTEYQNLMNYGVKMRVTRKITDGKATITYTVIPFIDANKTEGQVLFEVTQADIDQGNFGNNYQIATETLQFVWHNMETAGEYSNIRWAHTSTPEWIKEEAE